MSENSAPDHAAYASRFMIAFSALRSYIATQSVINYPPGLSSNQIKMLHLISHRPGISQTVAAERLGVTTASISASVREMEEQGLIERRSDPDDARVMLLHLAPQGEQLFEQVFSSFTQTCAKLLSALPAEDQRMLIERLEQALTANHVSIESGTLSYADKVHTCK